MEVTGEADLIEAARSMVNAWQRMNTKGQPSIEVAGGEGVGVDVYFSDEMEKDFIALNDDDAEDIMGEVSDFTHHIAELISEYKQ